MISTTLRALVEAEPALKRLAAKDLPVKASYRASKLLTLVRGEADLFREQHQKHVQAMGAERPAKDAAERARLGDTVHEVTDDNRAAFVTLIQELGEQPVTLPWDPIDLATCGRDFTISPADIAALGPLVTMTEEPPEEVAGV
jgi:hypothetical protein